MSERDIIEHFQQQALSHCAPSSATNACLAQQDCSCYWESRVLAEILHLRAQVAALERVREAAWIVGGTTAFSNDGISLQKFINEALAAYDAWKKENGRGD